MSEFFDNDPDIITIEEINTMNQVDNGENGPKEIKTMNIDTDIEEHNEKADEDLKQIITEEPDQKEPDQKDPLEKKHIIKIKFKIEHILIGLLTICGILIVLISYQPMILIDLLICIIIVVIGCLYIVDKNLTMKILETCLLSIPLFISKSPIFLI
jgi:hypothetical protein